MYLYFGPVQWQKDDRHTGDEPNFQCGVCPDLANLYRIINSEFMGNGGGGGRAGRTQQVHMVHPHAQGKIQNLKAFR